ncbi:MAG: hypothetical protein M3237_02265 [Actinomycetota bacterium]|nr:hypothetical protein [Actinomycetota bacterium]
MTAVHEGERPTTSASSSAPPTARRRGRPFRLPTDPTPIPDPVPGLGHRLAWLLGSSRIYASDPEVARRDSFIGALQEVGTVADTTRLSRWESGRVGVPMSVVRAYETVLGLPAGQLIIGASGLVRGGERVNRRGETPQVDPTQAHLRLDELFETVLAGRAPGHVWLDLCDHLTRQQHLYLLPDTWRQISDLLATELGCSTGLAYVARFDALRTLVANPPSRRHAVKAIGSVVTHPATVFMIHPLVLLQEVDDEQAWDLLARILQGPPSTLRAGAAWALAGKVTRGDFAGLGLEGVEALVVDILQRSRSSLSRLDALTLVRALPAESQTRIALQTTEATARTALDLAQRNAEIRDAHRARSVSSKIADAAQNTTAIDYLVGQDQMLHRLVREALFHVDHGRRHQASLLLAASPYRAALGHPLMELAARSKETIAVTATAALFQIADQRQRSALLKVSLSDPRATVRAAALMALGQVVGEVSAEESDRLRAILDHPVPEPLKGAVLHVLGMGSAPCLEELASDGPHTEAARWWLDRQPIVEPMGRG